jgi:hypothetical protein
MCVCDVFFFFFENEMKTNERSLSFSRCVVVSEWWCQKAEKLKKTFFLSRSVPEWWCQKVEKLNDSLFWNCILRLVGLAMCVCVCVCVWSRKGILHIHIYIYDVEKFSAIQRQRPSEKCPFQLFGGQISLATHFDRLISRTNTSILEEIRGQQIVLLLLYIYSHQKSSLFVLQITHKWCVVVWGLRVSDVCLVG